MNEARRLGTCTDTLTRREKNDSLAHSSTATTYVGFSVLPRSINIKSNSDLINIKSELEFTCTVAAPIRLSGMLCFTSSEVPNGVSGKACSGSYCTWLHQCGCYIWLDCSHIAPPYQG